MVPAAPDAWIRALTDFGTMSFAEVAEAAIRFAREGFAVHPFMAEIIAGLRGRVSAVALELGRVSAEGRPPRVGERFVQT